MAWILPSLGWRAHRVVWRILIAFSIVLITLRQINFTVAAATADEIVATATWFDSLDSLPDLRDKPYVVISYRKTWSNGAMVDQFPERGFLLAEDDKTYTLFCDGVGGSRGFSLDGWQFGVKRFRKPADSEDIGGRSIRRLDLATAADEAIAEVEKPQTRPGARNNSSERTALFILARCFSERGRDDLAIKLDAVLLNLTKSDKGPFRAFVEKDIAHSLMWRAVVEFGEPAVSRPELLAQFERIARDFPTSEHRDKAAEYAATLRAMIAEDEAHAASAKPLATMTREEQAREWVFRLRDQHGVQVSEPGGVEFLEPLVQSAPEPSPAMHLVQLGYAAVPALIEALDDHRFTRSVQCHRSFHFSHYPLPISDCVQAILSRISGRRFRVAPGQEPHRITITDWWREMEGVGEKEMLVRNVSAAIDWCQPQIQRLIELDPNVAVEALKKGIAKSQVEGVQDELIEGLGQIQTDAATNALRDALKHWSSIQGRVTAARELLRRGERGIVPAMIADWNKWDRATHGEEDPDSLIEFLSQSGDVAAMEALAAQFGRLSTEDKVTVLGWATGTHQRHGSPQSEKAPISKKVAPVAEQLAISALEEPGSNTIWVAELEGANFMYPRVRDLAAYTLAKAWPERYAFTWAESPFARDVQITKLRNLSRTVHGLAPLPLPERPSHPAAAADPNVVAGCRWIDGPEVHDLPISVGKPLTGDELFDTIAKLEKDHPPGCAAFHVTVDRSANHEGIAVEITWIHGRESPSNRLNSYDCLFAVGNKQVHRTNTSMPSNNPREPIWYGDERRATDHLLGMPAEHSVTIRFYCW